MVTRGYGLTAEEIDMSCPRDLEPYEKAYLLELKNRDVEMWSWWGAYGKSALLNAMDLFFNGKKAKIEYTDKPIYAECIEKTQDSELTEDEVKQQRMLHRLKMETMKANFDLSRLKEEEVK